MKCTLKLKRGIGQVQHRPPDFSKNFWDFHTIRSVRMGNDCILIPSITFQNNVVLEKFVYVIYIVFSIFRRNFGKHTYSTWPMGHSGNDAIYIRPHKMKRNGENKLKIAE